MVSYFQGKYQDSIGIFNSSSELFLTQKLSDNDTKNWEKLLSLFLLGQLVGLSSLNSILERHQILSNNEQIKYTRLCKKLTSSVLLKMYQEVFQNHLLEKLQSLLAKDKSSLSRELVTVVLDDSIFKHIFGTNRLKDADTEDCYGAFFSGQFKASVCGFKVLTLAVVIDGLLYPLFFSFVAKQKKTVQEKEGKEQSKSKEKTSLPTSTNSDELAIKAKKEAKLPKETIAGEAPIAIKDAEKLIQKYGFWKAELRKKSINLPDFHFSCDNGYSHVLVAEACQKNGLRYISVPKKNHYFIINNERIRLDEFIEKAFLIAEKEHLEQEKNVGNDKKNTPFTMRIKATYDSQKQDVIMLFFRLNNSSKVSAIYSTNNPNIFAKTLRRHWFNRTYIDYASQNSFLEHLNTFFVFKHRLQRTKQDSK